jgi:hypothetical protein
MSPIRFGGRGGRRQPSGIQIGESGGCLQVQYFTAGGSFNERGRQETAFRYLKGEAEGGLNIFNGGGRRQNSITYGGTGGSLPVKQRRQEAAFTRKAGQRLRLLKEKQEKAFRHLTWEAGGSLQVLTGEAGGS